MLQLWIHQLENPPSWSSYKFLITKLSFWRTDRDEIGIDNNRIWPEILPLKGSMCMDTWTPCIQRLPQWLISCLGITSNLDSNLFLYDTSKPIGKCNLNTHIVMDLIVKGNSNFELGTAICYVNVENNSLTSTKHIAVPSSVRIPLSH